MTSHEEKRGEEPRRISESEGRPVRGSHRRRMRIRTVRRRAPGTKAETSPEIVSGQRLIHEEQRRPGPPPMIPEGEKERRGEEPPRKESA